MKILFVSDTYYPHINGVYYFVCRIGPLLQERGHEVAVIAPSDSMHFSHKKIDGLDVHGLPALSILLYPNVRIPIRISLKSRIKQIIQDFKPDIIHIQDHFLISKIVVQVSEDLKIPIIATNHFMPENITVLLPWENLRIRFEKFLWKGFSRVFNKVKIVTTPTETGARLIRPKLNVDAIAITSGINLEDFSPLKGSQFTVHGSQQYNERPAVAVNREQSTVNYIKEKYGIPNKPILLYVGKLDPEKHIEEILQSVSITLKKTDFCFVIVGKGTKKKSLEKLTHQLGISENVIFTGFVSDEDLPVIYKLSRCFIIASIAELLSLATLQAMASGLPVIAVNAGALGELVKNNMNGYLYKEGDVSSIAQYIEDILTRDDLYRKMSEKSLEYVQKHDIYKTVESFERLYQVYSLSNSTKNNVHERLLKLYSDLNVDVNSPATIRQRPVLVKSNLQTAR